MLVRQKIQSQPPINNCNIKWILRQRRAERACERDGDFGKRHQRLEVDERQAADGHVRRERRDARAHRHRTKPVDPRVAQELAVLVVDVEAWVADGFLGGGELGVSC